MMKIHKKKQPQWFKNKDHYKNVYNKNDCTYKFLFMCMCLIEVSDEVFNNVNTLLFVYVGVNGEEIKETFYIFYLVLFLFG